MRKNRFTAEPEYGKAMTLDELCKFVKLVKEWGGSGELSPRVYVTWAGKIRRIETTVVESIQDYSE